jgi:hypothetical protein
MRRREIFVSQCVKSASIREWSPVSFIGSAERPKREIAEYALLNQSAMQSTKIIAETLAQWKNVAAPQSARG